MVNYYTIWSITIQMENHMTINKDLLHNKYTIIGNSNDAALFMEIVLTFYFVNTCTKLIVLFYRVVKS
jgi:hypothetical protein